MSAELSVGTQQKLKNISKSLLHLHKALLDFERDEYEKLNGKVRTPNELFGLVIDHPHFAWLRILSGHIVLIDEFLGGRNQKHEAEGVGLIEQTKQLLEPESKLDDFDKKLQNAIQKSNESFVKYDATLKILE